MTKKLYVVGYQTSLSRPLFEGFYELETETKDSVVIKFNETKYLCFNKTSESFLIGKKSQPNKDKVNYLLFLDKKALSSYRNLLNRKKYLVKILSDFQSVNLETLDNSFLEKYRLFLIQNRQLAK